MARLEITPQALLGSYPSLPIAANGADITFTAAGASFAAGAQVPLAGGEILIVKNGNATTQTVTITSVADEKKRTGDITTYSIGAGEIAAFGPFELDGWRQSDGKLYFAASAADVSFAVLKLA